MSRVFEHYMEHLETDQSDYIAYLESELSQLHRFLDNVEEFFDRDDLSFERYKTFLNDFKGNL